MNLNYLKYHLFIYLAYTPEFFLICYFIIFKLRKKHFWVLFSRFDWFQTKTTVTLVVYTKWKSMKSDFVVIDKQGNDFLATLYIEDYIYYLHIGK